MIEVSPTAHDVVGPGTFNVEGTVNVHGLAPDTGYRLLRSPDFNPDGVCTGTAALILPGNPTLTTSAGGAGALHFEVSRGAPFLEFSPLAARSSRCRSSDPNGTHLGTRGCRRSPAACSTPGT